jgi:hypothetical protein
LLKLFLIVKEFPVHFENRLGSFPAKAHPHALALFLGLLDYAIEVGIFIILSFLLPGSFLIYFLLLGHRHFLIIIL